jgi:hypothetical protein
VTASICVLFLKAQRQVIFDREKIKSKILENTPIMVWDVIKEKSISVHRTWWNPI